MDYSEAGRNVLADLVTKWGGQWWEHGVNVMDCLHQVEKSIIQTNSLLVTFEA